MNAYYWLHTQRFAVYDGGGMKPRTKRCTKLLTHTIQDGPHHPGLVRRKVRLEKLTLEVIDTYFRKTLKMGT